MRFKVDQLWIDEDALAAPLTAEIVRKLPEARVLKGGEFAKPGRKLDLSSDPLSYGKKIIRLRKHRGAFIKPCPGTHEYVCCGLKILHIGQGCPMDCRYCALQVYFNRSVIEVFVNTDEMLHQLDRFLQSQPSRFHRICTGEFTDSLALDPLTGLSDRLLDFFARVENASLEIKTKTDLVAPLLKNVCRGRIILSFSVNARAISRTEERRATPLHSRIRAAAQAQTMGYLAGFHFDPIIPFPGWEDEYIDTIDEIFRAVDPSRVAWISMGVLRFVPRLKEVVTLRFGPVPYFHDAFLRGLDGKSRIEVTRRVHIYRMLAERIRQYAPDVRIYLCMESPSVWKDALGIPMESDDDLSNYLDEAVQ